PSRALVLHALDLIIERAAIAGGPKMTDVTYDGEAETATLRFDGEVAAGERVLELDWSGQIRESLRGLYRSTRPGERYAATQFEAADARRAFPCFDEPEFKARFAIELVHPAGLTAIGNMPIPYLKVDAIGIHGYEAGAMENPGAITYRVYLLAADERNASVKMFKGIFSTAAHELTHMWWGDLVTMPWWTDLWLNESFASFVGEKATAALNPEWRY